MIGRVYSAALKGIEGTAVQVETDVSDGLPGFDMVGFLSSEVREARERVRTAIKNTGVLLMPKRYTINLSPADVRKEGNYFDLPIAISILGALELVPLKNLEQTMFIGELGLDGKIRPIRGTLSLVMTAKEMGMKRCIVPWVNSPEGSIVKNIEVYGMKNLEEVIQFLRHPEKYDPVFTDADQILRQKQEEYIDDFSEINGQLSAKRAALAAAAGFHNLLMIGPPGSGKSMIAKRLPGILPSLTLEEAIEITKVHSVCGLLKEGDALVCTRPYRDPHHTISVQALAGGGRIPRPGEISMASKGVLFLDELPEFHPAALEILRQPLEERKIMLSRVYGTYQFPADCLLIAAMNPCKCGYYPDRKICCCSENDVRRYLGRISSPLLDRIDICIKVPKLEYGDLMKKNGNTSSEEMRKQVEQAVEIQKERYKDENILFNSQLSSSMLEKYCPLGKKEKNLLKNAYMKLGLSARAYHRIIKVSRTLADLGNEKNITENHICEAIQYRSYDQKVWGR